jgi:hypothetical protein
MYSIIPAVTTDPAPASAMRRFASSSSACYSSNRFRLSGSRIV